MADALDSGSSEVILVWVQLPSTALFLCAGTDRKVGAFFCGIGNFSGMGTAASFFTMISSGGCQDLSRTRFCLVYTTNMISSGKVTSVCGISPMRYVSPGAAKGGLRLFRNYLLIQYVSRQTSYGADLRTHSLCGAIWT